MKYLWILIVVFAIISCGQTKTTSGDNFHGNSFEIKDPISVNDMMSKLDENQPIEGLTVKGTVVDVCQAKGCWMTLRTVDGNDVRVTFKDYGFFVPKDLSGKDVVVKGKGQIEITSVEDLQHFAADEGQTKEQISAITEALEEYTFVAEGVKIN